MNNFYIAENGTLKRKDNSLLFETEDREILIPVHQVRHIYCYGETSFNKRVLEFLSRHQISLSFFDYYGKLSGRYIPAERKIGDIYILQIGTHQNEMQRNLIARQIQAASIHNCISVLKYYNKKGIELTETIDKMQFLHGEMCQNDHDVESLLLLEARAKKLYYSAFDVLLEKTSFRFEHRSFNPPLNEVNSLMSFGYHLVYASILAEIDQSPLLPEIGYIHSDLRKGPNLHFDLADIFKPVLIDRLIFRLIRRGEITPQDFEKRDSGVYFKKASLKKFVTAYDHELEKIIQYGSRRLSYQSILRMNVYALVNYIEGKSGVLEFYKMSW